MADIVANSVPLLPTQLPQGFGVADGSGGGARGSLVMSSLTKRYGDRTALATLDLTVRSGEFFTLLGPSGSGKTTTLMLIAGFAEPDSGQITLDSASLVGIPPERRNIGVVFQNYALFPHLDVFGNMSFPLRIRGMGRSEIAERVRDSLEMVGLGGYERSYPSQLSGGQQQRVALARAIIFEPSILLMDEPLGALDRRLRLQLQVELRRLQRQLGVTVVYVTHDQEEALSMSDRIAVLSAGRLEQVGTPQEVYERPRSNFVADFIGDSNTFAAQCVSASAQSCELRTADGMTVYYEAPGAPDRGESVTVVIRPEALAVDTGPGTSPNCWAGVVDEVMYLGAQTKCWVALTAGPRLMVIGSARAQGRPLSPGSPVTVSCRPSDPHLIRSG